MRRLVFRHGWDTRVRHHVPVKLIKQALNEIPGTHRPRILDVGCGTAGIAAFLPSLEVTGIDREEPAAAPPNLRFVQGPVTRLPFGDATFDVVTSIDVLEYLSAAERSHAIREMLRVVRREVVIACPDGELARGADADYERALIMRSKAIPEWITGAAPHPYPTAGEIRAAIADSAPEATVTVSHLEPIIITRMLRKAAVRSTALYLAANLGAGLMLPFLPTPTSELAYRLVAHVRLDEPDADAAR